MDEKVDTRRIDKRSSKKNRSDEPYSAKHVRHQNRMMELNSTRSILSKAADSSKAAKPDQPKKQKKK